MNKKLRFGVLLSLSLLMTGGSLRYKPIENEIENITQEVEDCINEEIQVVLERRYNDTNANTTYIIDEVNELSNRDEEISKQEISNEIIKDIYVGFDEDVKIEIEKLKEDNPDIDLIYKMFRGENYSLEDYPIETPIFTGNETKQILNSSFRKLNAAISIALPSYILASMTSCISGACSASWIPFVGWAVAAVLIVALIVIIAVKCDTIKRTFDDIKAYFMAKFARISELIASTMDQAKKENQRNVYFPYNPYDFHPKYLIRGESSGTGNGREMWKNEGRITIFRWDKDLRWGRHYHTRNDNFSYHFHAGDQVPEKLVNLYF